MRTPEDVFLLIGQSNMAGRGPMDAVPALRHPNLLLFRAGQWIPAEEPLHTDKPEIAGVGLGMSFALSLLKADPDQAIGLLPCAVGGTPLSRWMPGADLYADAVAVTRNAGACGKLRGILWHQGENDAQREEDARSYGRRLAEMIAALRADLEATDVPFIAGELGEFLKDCETCGAFFRVINDELRSLHERVPGFGLVSSAGLTDNGDHLHFNSPSLRELGRRYAREYLALRKKGGRE